MAHRLTEGLLNRAQQWKIFHEWEQNRNNAILTVGERVTWYAAAFDLIRESLGKAVNTDKSDKTNQIHNLHTRLKHLKRSYHDGRTG